MEMLDGEASCLKFTILDRFKDMAPEQQDRAKKELASSYKSIMSSIAWRHLTEEIERIYADSYKTEDNIPINEFGLGHAAKARGIREGLDALKKKIQYAVAE